MERQVSVLEYPPCIKHFVKRYWLANAEERAELQQQLPTYIVRLASDEEIDQLQGKSWEQMEKEEMDRLLREAM